MDDWHQNADWAETERHNQRMREIREKAKKMQKDAEDAIYEAGIMREDAERDYIIRQEFEE